MEATQEEPKKTFVETINMYALYAGGDEGDCETVHAISTNTDNLQKILEKMDEELKHMANQTIKKIEIYSVVKKDLFGYSILTRHINPIEANLLENNLYAFYHHENQALFLNEDLSLDSEYYEKTYKFFKNGISSRLIKQNEFYDEGVLNA